MKKEGLTVQVTSRDIAELNVLINCSLTWFVGQEGNGRW